MEIKRNNYLKSVENTLRILNYFGSSGFPELSMAEIKEATGLSKATVFRNLKVLSKYDYVEKNERTAKYRLGTKIVELAAYRIDTLEIRTESLPVLMLVQARTSASISLCELQGTNVVKLFMIRGNLIIKNDSHDREKLPAYCSAPGKVLLSGLSGHELEQLYLDYEFIRYTDTTITNIVDLKKELKKIREQGFAINNGEQESYTRNISVPIYGYSGNIIAAIGAGMNQENFTPENRERCLNELRTASSIISHKMGWK